MNAAHDGDRLTLTQEGRRALDKPKTLWAGLGNRAGLYSFAYELLDEKFRKSRGRLLAKLEKLPPKSRVNISRFHNANRDRGRWVVVRTETL